MWIFCTVFLLSGGLAAAVTRGPYLEAASDTEMTLRWRTSAPECSDVWIGGAPGSLAYAGGTAAAVTEHARRLSGLAAGTDYFYAVGCSGSALVGDDALHYFRTAPNPLASPSIRLWAIGDSGTGDANAAAVRDAYLAFSAAERTDLWIQLGDSAYETGTDAEFQTALFNMYPSLLRTVSLYPAIGNHETYSPSPAFFSIHSLPASTQSPAYSFDYGHAHFICLDSQTQSRQANGAMAAWLRNDLQASASKAWTIAYFHHPPYSKGSHDSDTELELKEIREQIIPILEEFGVDLVLSGHSHAYERSVLLRGHYGSAASFLPDLHALDAGPGPYQKFRLPGGAKAPFGGTVYVVAGSSGKLSPGPLNHPAMAASRLELGSLVIDVHANSIQARFLNSLGLVSDQFSILSSPGPQPGIHSPGPARLKAYPQPLRGSATLRVIAEDPLRNRIARSLEIYTLAGGLVASLRPEVPISPTPFAWRTQQASGGTYLAVAKGEGGEIIARGKLAILR